MTGKKRRRKPAARRPSQSPTATPRSAPEPRSGGASAARRERKELARRAREAERKRVARVAALRRALTFALVGVAALGIFWFFQRAAATRPIPQYARAAAQAAGCSGVQTPTNDPQRTHLQSGASYDYPQKPATSGPHDPSPWSIDPRVNATQIPETRAVHSLEHGEIIVYYRADGAGALPKGVVDALATVANASKNTLVSPYPDLPTGTSLAFTAWNKLQTCPATITAAQATSVAYGFEYAFACTGNAPESKTASSSNGC